MPDLFALVPITVTAAVLLFILKETVEAVRRARGDQRKIHALKALLARECELNLWTIKSLRSIFINVPKRDEEDPQIFVEIERRDNAAPIACIRSTDGAIESTREIPKVHRDLMTKYLLDVATLDKNLFQALETAYDAVAELEHVRESLLRVHENEAKSGSKDFFSAFAEYALEELFAAENALSALYVYCTGKPLEKHRLR